MILIIYLVLTAYVLLVVGSTNLTLFEITPAILIMWVCFLSFSSGYLLIKSPKSIEETVRNDKTNNHSSLFETSGLRLILLSLVSVLFSAIAARYYTGQTPVVVFTNLVKGTSVYYEYQRYFAEAEIATFSLSKLPYILMLFYIKFMLFYGYLKLLLGRKKLRITDKISLALVTIAHVYFGIARGTNFEIFELFILIVFVVLSKSRGYSIKRSRVKQIIFIGVLGLILITVYYWSVTSRGVVFGYRITSDVWYDHEGVVSVLFPALASVSTMLYGYFGFGFFYLSRFVSDVWFLSLGSFLAGLVPRGFELSGKGSISAIMKRTIDMGPRWHPDASVFINDFGFLGLIVLCFFLGFIAARLTNNPNREPVKNLPLFLVVLQMVSLPIGNFVLVSSASKLIVVLVVLWLIWTRVRGTLSYAGVERTLRRH